MNKGARLLRRWIDKRGYKQNETAEMLDLAEPHLSMYLNGLRTPGRDNALKIEAMTGIPARAWSLSVDNESLVLLGVGAGKRKINKK